MGAIRSVVSSQPQVMGCIDVALSGEARRQTARGERPNGQDARLDDEGQAGAHEQVAKRGDQLGYVQQLARRSRLSVSIACDRSLRRVRRHHRFATVGESARGNAPLRASHH